MNRLRNFMIGRYGLDSLSIGLIILGCIISFTTSFFRVHYYSLLSFIPYGLAFARILSKNISARQKENEHFLKYWFPVKNFFLTKHRQHADKDHKYYKCPQCRHVLRVPSGRGKIIISCPFCQRKFKRNTGKQKVNIV